MGDRPAYRWPKVEKGIAVTISLKRDINYTRDNNGDKLTIKEGECISGTYQGYRQTETSFEIIILTENRCTFPFYPANIRVDSIEAKHCFRCDWWLSPHEFIRHSLTQDQSPILSEVCEKCYRKVKTKVAAYSSEARRRGGKGGLKASEWLEMLKASQERCFYCNAYVGYEKLILEHRKPLSLQGDNLKENVVPACQSCNNSKSDRDFETWQKSLEAKRLLIRLQEHLNLGKFEVTNLAVKALAEKLGLIDESEEAS